MKFSVIISSYNKGKYLEECIASCINQSYQNKEIILVDNYSDDNSQKILNKYTDQIKIIYKKKISDHPALNQIDLIKEGLKFSKGEIICLLDADDYFFENKILELSKIFEKNNLDIIFDIPLIKSKSKYKKLKLKKKNSEIHMANNNKYKCNLN